MVLGRHLNLAGWGLEAVAVEAVVVEAAALVAQEGPPLLRARPQGLEAAGVEVALVEAAAVVAPLPPVLMLEGPPLLQGFLPNPGGLEAAAAVVAREGPTLFLARPQAVEAADLAQEGPPQLHWWEHQLQWPRGLEAADVVVVVVVVAGPAVLSHPFVQSAPPFQLVNYFF